MSGTPLWHAAAALAAKAHRNQVRKDGLTPYVAHPLRVALIIVMEFECADDAVLAAALLHDVIEDCDCDYDDVLKTCGREVADLVAAMTKDMRLVEAEREQAYEAQLAAAPWKARLIKLADTFDNLRDAGTPGRRSRAIVKAKIAIRLAEDESNLAAAANRLRGLVEAYETSARGDAAQGVQQGKSRPADVSSSASTDP